MLSRGGTAALSRGSLVNALIRMSLCALLLWPCSLDAAAQSLDEAVAAYGRNDYARALRLFEDLGAKGDKVAQHNAGHMYVNGLGTKRDYSKAMIWYRRAADQGFAPSQYDIGLMYAEGEGVKLDPVQAMMWFRKSAEQGFLQAQVKLAEIAIAQGNNAEAFFWWKNAADAGDALSMFNIASAYFAGRGVEKDRSKAIEYYRKARSAGNEDADRILKELGADCVRSSDTVELEGQLSERKFQSASGSPLRAFVLTLPTAICMRGDDEMENVDGVRDIQLMTSDRPLERKMRALLGKTVLVRGTISPGLTAWFYSRIVMDVGQIETGSVAAACYDILGCADRDLFSLHFDYLSAPHPDGPNCEFLWQMRNAIFARHGYCFKTEKGKAVFGNEGCRYNEIESMPLNEIERANVATIARAERMKSCTR